MRSRLLRAAQLLVLVCGVWSASAAPIPEVKFVEVSKEALIGDTVTFCVTFKNVGDAAGYAPYIDLVLPSRGIDGPGNNGPCDGISYLKAEMIDVMPSPVPLTPASPTPSTPCGSVDPFPHPFTANGANGVDLPNAQDQLVTIPLPFGSFDPTQPLVKVRVTAKVHPFADDGGTLQVYARGGFRFGITPVNNPPNETNLLNPLSAIAATWPPMAITPRVVVLTERYKGAENEIVPGPSFASSFEIALDVAPGQTVNGLILKDCASTAATVFTAITAATPPGVSNITPSNCFTVAYGSPIVGGSPGPEVLVDARFHVGPNFPLAPACSGILTNQALIHKGTWTPQDPRDVGSPNPAIPLSGNVKAAITVRQIAINKTVKPLSPLGPVPGTMLQYDLRFAVSDYLRFGNLVIEDTFSDGQVFVPATATLAVKDKYGSATVNSLPFTATKNVTETYRCPAHSGECHPPAGTTVNSTLPFGTRLRFDVSAAMLGKGAQSFAQGILTGALVAPASATPATGSISFRVNIPQTFTYVHPPALDDKFVDKEDPLYNAARINAQQYKNAPIVSPAPANVKCGDDTYTCLSVPGDVLEKRVIARNGIPIAAAPLSSPQFQHDDTITFRLTKKIPSGDAQSVQIRDWLPLPAIQVPPSLTLLTTPCSATPPGVNQACSTFTPVPIPTVPPVTPVSTDAATNNILFDLGSVQSTATPLSLTIEFTLKIANAPMADELLLTNEAQECEKNSYGATICRTAIAQLQVTEPSLRIYKGILCASGTCPQPLPTPVIERALEAAPAAICKSPAPCPRFSGIVSSNTLAGFIGNGTLLADAGDRVTFVVAVENTGHSPDGAHDIQLTDVLGSGLTFVPGSLCVTRGDGVPIATTSTSFPLTLVDPSGPVGALTPHSPTTGRNIAVLTFDAVIEPATQVKIGSCLTNRAEVTSYSNMEGGANFVAAGFPAPPLFATAQACVRPKEVNKSIAGTSEPHTGMGPPPKLAIGEVVRYRLRFHMPEGTGAIHVVDALPPNLQFMATPAPTISTAGVNTSLTWTQFTWSSNVDFDLGTVTNKDNDLDCEYAIVDFSALVMNTPSNDDGQTKPNSFVVTAGGQTVGTSNVVTTQIVEPKLSITKTAITKGALAVFTVTVTNPSATTTFDVAITDVPGACLQGLIKVSAVSSGGASNATGTNPVLVQQIPPGGSVVITYQAKIACDKCGELNNTARVTWTSLPGNGAATPGLSGTTNGERNGSGGVNDYLASTSVSLCGKVCGVKFEDTNGNRLRDANEPLLSGWTITAADTAGTIVANAVTAADGKYCLELPPGTYQICETPQLKWQQTYPATDCHTVSVTAGASLSPFDFGNRPCWARVCGIKTTPSAAGLGQPLAGWTIVAHPTDPPGPPIVSQPTNADGRYCIDLPGPGPYTLTEVQQTGWVMTVPKEPYSIYVECIPSPTTGAPGTAVVMEIGDDPADVPFENVNLCAGTKCPAGEQCEVHDGKPVCVKPPAISPCAVLRCGFGMHCAVINGEAVCVP